MKKVIYNFNPYNSFLSPINETNAALFWVIVFHAGKKEN